MTNAQRTVRRYINTQFVGVKVEDVGTDEVKITDRTGATMTLSCNIYGDILEIKADDNGEHRMLAVSNLPHNLLGEEIPTSWTTLPYK